MGYYPSKVLQPHRSFPKLHFVVPPPDAQAFQQAVAMRSSDEATRTNIAPVSRQ